MSAGKLAAQAGHAYLDSYLQATADRAAEYRGDSHGTKVCLCATSLDALLDAAEEALRAGVPHSLIIDSGHVMPPYFTGAPVVTALGLGPALRSEVRTITKRFALVP
jgi:PTH2 family peptidyl-tRNA hydrolase